MTHDWDGVADLNFEYQVTYTCADPAHKIFYGTSELEFFTIACLWSGDWSTDVRNLLRKKIEIRYVSVGAIKVGRTRHLFLMAIAFALLLIFTSLM